MVVFWNLPTNSPLQRIRLSDGSLKLYPFQCFLAHDQAVRTLQWCKANRYRTGLLWAGRWSRGRLVLPDSLRFDLLPLLPSFHSHFLVSAGSDRKIKFWDLRRPYEPINSIKRFLSTELAWLLPYNGVTVAQDNCYASYGRTQIGGALGTGPKGWGAKCDRLLWGEEGWELFHWGNLNSGRNWGREMNTILEKGKFYFVFPLQLWTLWNSLYWCWLPWFQGLFHCSSQRHCLGEPLSSLHRKTIPLLTYRWSGRGSFA